MKVDLRIAGGTVIDPERASHGPAEVLIKGNVIVASAQGEAVEAETTIDASGCLVVPGLIDFHAHLYGGGTESGIFADGALPPMGVTTGVDAGSCGTANYEMFYRTVVATSRVRLFGFLHICSGGLIATRYPEEMNPKYYDEEAIAALLCRYRGQCLGLKIRFSKEVVGEFGLKTLETTLAIAERLGCPIVVHTTNPAAPPDTIVSLLRPGDVYCHAHQGVGETIIAPDGKVRPALVAAQKSGIIFDACNGRNNFSFKVAQAAIRQGFFPDVISTDVTQRTLYSEFVFSLPYVMMKYLNMGMQLEQVLAACTSVPARLIGMKGKLGTLAPGALADVAIFRATKKELKMTDVAGNTFTGNHVLVPQMTVLDGKIAYRQIDFQ
jgi:predicted amidohydrolase